jgi:hypothetical protein
MLILGGALVCAVGLILALRPFTARYIEEVRTCHDLKSPADDYGREVLFLSGERTYATIGQGLFHIELRGYCYYAECDLDLREIPETMSGFLASRMTCRGDKVWFQEQEFYVDAFIVPSELKTLRARVVRNGVVVYDDIVGREQCYAGFCLFDSPFNGKLK